MSFYPLKEGRTSHFIPVPDLLKYLLDDVAVLDGLLG